MSANNSPPRSGGKSPLSDKSKLQGNGLNTEDTFTSKPVYTGLSRITVGKERPLNSRCTFIQSIHITVQPEQIHVDRLHKALVKFIKEFEKK